MPKFTYVALGPERREPQGRRGRRHARGGTDRRCACARTRSRSLVAKKSLAELRAQGKHIKRADLMHLSRQLSAFIRAGIPILDAIQTLADDADSDEVRTVMEAIGQDLRTGSTLAEAVDRHPADFPMFYRGILASAELTGNLDSVLDQLSGYLERDLEARRQIKSAMIYPGVVAGMAVVTIGDPQHLRAAEVRGLLRRPRREAPPPDPAPARDHPVHDVVLVAHAGRGHLRRRRHWS